MCYRLAHLEVLMGRRDRLVRQALRERFVVTLVGGESFDGLLMDIDEQTIQLVDAYALDKANRVPVDGTVYLPRSEVAYMQKPEASR
jgi:hypothetical protein